MSSNIRVLHLPAAGGHELLPESFDIASLLASPNGVFWVDIDGDGAEVEKLLKETFQFHPLAVEDALSQIHVPRIDDWGSYIYVVLTAVSLNKQTLELKHQELDLFLGHHYLVTVHSGAMPPLEKVWDALSKSNHGIHEGADHLMYEILDAMAVDMMNLVDDMDEEIDEADEKVFSDPDPSILNRYFKLKRALLDMRRLLTPTREVLNKLARDEYAVIDRKDRIYFRDVYDHLVRLVDINESLRDMVGGALETYLSVVSNRLNEVMKTLTVVTLVFMPLTFVTGFFGMNFFGGSYEVPLRQHLSVPLLAAAIASMAASPLFMLVWMKRKRWI